MSQQEKEQRILNKCLRKRLWCSKICPTCDSEGFPNKGNKKNWTDKLQKRYSILTPDLPLSWTPEAVLMDGMFFINITPLQHTSNVQEYGKFIYYTHTTQKEPMKYTYCSTVLNHRCSIQRNTNSTEGTGMYPKVLAHIPTLLSTQAHPYPGHGGLALTAGSANGQLLKQSDCHTLGLLYLIYNKGSSSLGRMFLR